MADEVTDPYDLSSFRGEHADLIHRHEAFLGLTYLVTDELAQIILNCARLAISKPESERVSGFLEAFILLASKVISHLESARMLLNIGRYGDVAVIIRGLFSDVMTVQYLSLFPADAEAWLGLARARPAEGTGDQTYKNLVSQFGEGRMRSKIQAKNFKPIASWKAFGAYSEAIHAGAWGLQFYSFQDYGSPGSFTVQFSAAYQPQKALAEASVLGALAAEVIDDFFAWCEDHRVEWQRAEMQAWLGIRDKAYRVFEAGITTVESAHREFFR